MYFYLNKYCYLVKGCKKCAIYNLENNKVYSLDEECSQLLINSESGNEIDEYYEKNSIYKDLENLKMGSRSDKKIFIDKFRVLNNNLATRVDLACPPVEKAYIRLNNNCNGKCKCCDTVFCPICFCDNHEEGELELTDWISIIDNLTKVGLKYVTFTGGDPLLYKDIDKLVDYCISKQVQVNIATSGIEKISNSLNRNINIDIIAFENRDYKSILDKFSDFKDIRFFYNNKELYNNLKNLDIKKENIIESNPDENIIQKDNLLSIDIQSFTIKKYFNPCLLSKVNVDYNGDVIPCFNKKHEVVGNLKTDKFNTVMDDLIRNYWCVPTENNKCLNCEFIYICPSCRYTDTDAKCNYNPAWGVW